MLVLLPLKLLQSAKAEADYVDDRDEADAEERERERNAAAALPRLGSAWAEELLQCRRQSLLLLREPRSNCRKGKGSMQLPKIVNVMQEREGSARAQIARESTSEHNARERENSTAD